MSPSYEARESPVSAPFQTVSPVVCAASWRSVVNRSRCSFALGEVEPGVLHVRARLGGDDVERLLRHVTAEVDRHPLDARVAADLDAPSREVVDLAAAPVLVVGEIDLRARERVQLEGARVERLALEVGGDEVLADLALGHLADDGQRVRPLRGARLVDHPDHLDRLLDLDVLRDVDEDPAGPERRRAGRELRLVVGEPLREVGLDKLRDLLDGTLERHHGDALVGDVRVDDARALLDDQRGVLLVAEVVTDDLRQLLDRLVALGLERVEVEPAQARRPEAGAAPGRDRLGLVGLECGAAAVLDELSRHRRPPPRGPTRSPCPRARMRARSRPRGRCGRR